MRLQWRGAFRQMCQSLATIRGIFFLVFILVMMVYGLGSLYFASRITAQSPQFTGAIAKLQEDFMPLGLLGILIYIILFSTGESTIYFTPSEAAFLFPAPITRKQLLSYILAKSLWGMAGVALFFSLYLSPSISMVIPRWLGIVMILTFLQLLTMTISFLRHLLQEKMHLQIRRGFGAVIAILLVLTFKQMGDAVQGAEFGLDFETGFSAWKSSATARWLLFPFAFIVKGLQAADWATFLPYGAVMLLVDGVLLQLAYRLDALSLEAALGYSEKRALRLKRLQSKGIWSAFSPNTSAIAQRHVPQLPFWNGIGPILWQRTTTTFRSSPKLIWVTITALAIAGGLVYLVGHFKDPSTATIGAPIAGLCVLGYMSFLICLTLQNDIEHVGFLKSLPISSTSIVIGDLVGFPTLLSLVQMLFILGLIAFFPATAGWLLMGVLLVLPINLVLFGVDKLVFYIYPTRMAKGAPGDFQNAGKQMIFMAFKMLILGAAALLTLVASLPVAFLLQSPLLAVICAGTVLLIQVGLLVPLLADAFERFEPRLVVIS